MDLLTLTAPCFDAATKAVAPTHCCATPRPPHGDATAPPGGPGREFFKPWKKISRQIGKSGEHFEHSQPHGSQIPRSKDSELLLGQGSLTCKGFQEVFLGQFLSLQNALEW